jgi:serine/threonine protein kinase
MNRSDDDKKPSPHPSATEGSTRPPPHKYDALSADTTRTTLDAPAAQALLPGAGTIVFERYRLRQVIGRGGMGVVWLAEDTKLERTVALKFLPDVIGGDPTALSELKDETRRGLELAHPNIVRIYDFVDDEEAAAISMEYVKGKTLADMRLAKAQKVFSAEELAPWARELCDALEYAHTQCQLVHRDLKPANLMVNAESHLKITDFGIARSMAETMTRISFNNANTSGTMLYMSPQQVMGERPRPTDDIYSVGATLYELLTGKPPFYRGNVSAQIASKKVPPVRERREELGVAAPDVVPEEWEAAIAACLDKDPALRPQSAMELAALLGLAPQTAARLPITARQASASPPPQESATEPPAPSLARPLWLRKRWLAAMAAVTGMVLWTVWWSRRPGEWAVQTYPTGAFVKLGEITQVAPAKFDHLRPGPHQATITLKDYEPRYLEFRVKPGQKVHIGVIKLDRVVGNISLSKSADEDFEITAVTTSVVPPQPIVGEPPKGSWNLDEVFLHSEYKNFSSNGRHYLLREAQRMLQDRGHFQGEITGDASTSLHKAIQTFQTLHELKPTGLLDSATLQFLGLDGRPDKADWTPESDETGRESWWKRHVATPFRRLFGD